MKHKVVTKVVVFLCLLFTVTTVFSQQISITPINDLKEFDGAGESGRIDFISSSPDLLIVENNGVKMQEPEKRKDGKYVYTFICDVLDTNKFGFNVSARGSINLVSLHSYIMENQLLEYEVAIEELPVSISEVKVFDSPSIVRMENTAVVKVTSNYQGLRITSKTGEQAADPVLNETNNFDYIIQFDLSTSESRELPRTLVFSAGKGNDVEQSIGTLSPKQGVNLSVLVVTNSCYADAIAHARQSFLNGAYREAYDTYQRLIEGNECTDKPENLEKDENEMKGMRRLAAAHLLATNYYNQAEKFQGEGMMDSCMHYHSEAYRYRNLILKQNPSDPYCLEYNRKYHDYLKNSPRVISGQILNAARMDAQGKNLPIPGVHILQIAHRKKVKMVNKVPVPEAGERIDSSAKIVGKSDENGCFTVLAERNKGNIIYVLHFTADRENFAKNSDSFQYTPKDVDKEMNITVKMVPKKINTYNETK